MAHRLLLLRLVPLPEFERLLAELRARHPGAEIVALSGAGDVPQADETIDWRARPRSDLLADLRRRSFDLAVVAHGRDHYASLAYWKALALASTSGAKARLLCEEGDLNRCHGLAFGLWRVLVQLAQEICAAFLGLLLLLPLLLALSLSDALEPLLQPLAGPKARQRKDTPGGTY